jgi:glycosyltransferase involved in cell wall biosynthesis
MKIAIIPSQLLKVPPRDYGGLETVCYDLGVALAKKGHDVTLFAPKGSSLPGGTVVETGDAPEQTQVDWNALEEAAYRIYDPRLREFDVIHDHSWFLWPYMSKFYHQDWKLKVCHTHHGQIAFKTLPPAEVLPMNMIGLSKSHALEISEGLGIQTRFVYNGVNLESFTYRENKEDWYLWLNRFSRFKGAHLAIQAAKKAGVRLKVAGSSFTEPNKDYFEQVKGMCDGSQIELILDVTNKEKYALLAGAKALLQTAVWPFKEPFGLTPIEAAASGTPTIALINGATPETVSKENGVLCVGTEELSDTMKAGVSATPKGCREWAQHFSREVMADAYLNCYRDVIEGRTW